MEITHYDTNYRVAGYWPPKIGDVYINYRGDFKIAVWPWVTTMLILEKVV